MSKSELLREAGEKRDLAERGRRLTRVFNQPDDRARAEAYVEELEATAENLEAEASAFE